MSVHMHAYALMHIYADVGYTGSSVYKDNTLICMYECIAREFIHLERHSNAYMNLLYTYNAL